jgi:hypothetical protein
MPEPVPSANRQFRTLEAILLAAAFAVAHTQSPLYYSNQNQYFLHGLADGGLGHLKKDWLANTTDPTPVFSALVAAGYRYLGEWSFQAAYFLMLMGYFLAARSLVTALPGVRNSRSCRLLWAAGFIAAHAAVLRVASVEFTDVDYPWYFQSGVASQYLLGPGLQPSAFGVLLLGALAAFANGRPVLACGLAALPCAFHSTYLLPSGLVVFGFVIVTLKRSEHSGPIAFRGMLLASAVFVPVTAITLFRFGPENPNIFTESQRILAEIRIPHHCIVERWFDLIAGLQLSWAFLGIVLLWRSPLFLVLLIAATLGVALTLAQYDSGNPTFALMFPWRISVLLVPVATAVILARLVRLVPASSIAEWIGAGLVLALVLGGLWVMAAKKGYHTNDAENAIHEYVRTHASPDDVYLLPVSMPAVGTGHGATSNTFTPPPRPKPGSNEIPVDWQRFRLVTGARIYVDFKSVPYADTQVLEWLRRMRQSEAWYAGDWNAVGVHEALRKEGVTHIVTPREKPIQAEYLEELPFNDAVYAIYRLK